MEITGVLETMREWGAGVQDVESPRHGCGLSPREGPRESASLQVNRIPRLTAAASSLTWPGRFRSHEVDSLTTKAKEQVVCPRRCLQAWLGASGPNYQKGPG